VDDIVKQALAKWPRVPHCYGWLALDARGAWRMRDERAQALGHPGDKITQAALLGFIQRNYTHDERGCWYFQNGPQRVYVTLETTPYIAHTDPARGWILHTGEPIAPIDSVWMTELGQLILAGSDRVAMLDDRDLAQGLTHLRMDNQPIADDQLLAWLKKPNPAPGLTLAWLGQSIPVQPMASQAIPAHFNFVRTPRS